MDAVESVIDYLAAPPRFFALALVVFLACRSSKHPWSRAGGAVIALLTTAFFGTVLADDGARRLILHPERLPVVLLAVSSLILLWIEMRRFWLPSEASEVRQAPAKSGFSTLDTTVATGVGLLLVACTWLRPASLGAVAEPLSPPALAKAPWFFVGLQELDAYFDPWVPYFALPLLLVAGLLGLPFIQIGSEGAGRRRSLFLLGWLLLWLWPMTVGALLRGPHWNAFGLFEAWDASRPAPPAPQPLSDVFWLGWLRASEPESWWWRELPGAILLAGYFVLLPIVLGRWRLTGKAYASYRSAMGPWPFRAALAWVLTVMIVPLKMYGQWLWNIGYWLHLPELAFNF